MRKILSLFLVLSMLFTVAGATVTPAFTDAGTINYTEAVDVLSAISVINGYVDGTFKPTGEVTRAEMAKMISTLLNKGEDVGSLYQGACTFTDSMNHWAAGYIAFCAQEHIINGRSATSFDPNANVTGTEAAKMLLCALGYNPTVEGLTGAAWAANTLSLSKKCELKARNAGGSVNEDVNFNLLTNLDSLIMSAPLTREAAAQMILNAMLCTKVDYDGNAQTITIGNTSFTTGATLLSMKTSIYNTYHTLSGANRLTKTITAGDDFGRPATTWTLGGENIGSYSTTPVAKYVNQVTGGQVYTDLAKPTFGIRDTDYMLKVFVDGVNVGDSLKDKIVSGNAENVTPAGSTTEIYVDDETMTITMVIIKNYIAQVSGVYAAQTDFNGDVTREAYITLKNVDDNRIPAGEVEFANGTRLSNIFITNEFTTYDRNTTYVVYTKAANKVQTVARAIVKTGITGSMTKTIDGTPVSLALDNVTYTIAATTTPFGADYGSNATIYLDANGTILYAEATASDAVAFVLAAGQEADGIYGDVTTGANLLFADGSTRKVTIYNENGRKYSADEVRAMAGTVVSYYVNANGEYVLNTLAPAGFNSYGSMNGIYKVINNNPALANGAMTMLANDNTVFIVENIAKDTFGANTYTYTVYHGLRNIPTVEEADPAGNGLKISAVNSRVNPSVANYVFVVGGKAKDASRASVAMFKRNPATDAVYTDANNNAYYTSTAVIDGQIVTAKMVEHVYQTLSMDTLNAFTNISTDTNGYITGLTAAADMDLYVKNYARFNGEDGLYNAGTIALVDALGMITPLSVTANTPIYVYDNTNNTVTTTSIDMFNTTQVVRDVKVVFDSSNKILNNVEIVTAIYAVIG